MTFGPEFASMGRIFSDRFLHFSGAAAVKLSTFGNAIGLIFQEGRGNRPGTNEPVILFIKI